MTNKYIPICILLFFITSTFGMPGGSSSETKSVNDTLKYIFLGHAYDYLSGNRVDPRVEGLNYSNFDRIWLGGDVCKDALLRRPTIEYLDTLFNLASPSTQYSLGNHDIRGGNMAWYREVTGKESYNVYSANGAVSICMNSQLNPSKCEELNNQFDMIKNDCDTINSNSYLFLLSSSDFYSHYNTEHQY